MTFEFHTTEEEGTDTSEGWIPHYQGCPVKIQRRADPKGGYRPVTTKRDHLPVPMRGNNGGLVYALPAGGEVEP